MSVIFETLNIYFETCRKMAVRSKTVGIACENRYFRRPVVPFTVPTLETTDIPYYSDRKVLSGILQRQCFTVSPKSEPYKNAGTQTDYRESEAQTDPWEPPYKIIPGKNNVTLRISIFIKLLFDRKNIVTYLFYCIKIFCEIV